MEGATGARLPLTARAATATSPHRRLRLPPQRASGPHALLPPRDRLRTLRRECVLLDRELKVLENSGHNRVGVFARPLVTQVSSRVEVSPTHTQTNDAVEGAVPEADDECRDPFFHQFYDDEGRSLFEQLLRARMRGLALAKLSYGGCSIAVARAEVELAEAYARLNLWKQGHPHVTAAKNVLKTLGEAQVTPKPGREAKGMEEGILLNPEEEVRSSLLSKALAHFYDLQSDEAARGYVGLAPLLGYIQIWQDELEATRCKREGDEEGGEYGQEMSLLFDHESLVRAFDASPTIHWQTLLVRLERESASMSNYVAQIEQHAQPEVLEIVRETFVALGGESNGVVSQNDLVAAISQQRQQLSFALYQQDADSDSNKRKTRVSRGLYLLTTALKRRRRRVDWPELTWCEILEIGCACRGIRFDQGGWNDDSDGEVGLSDDDNDDESQLHLARVLCARIDLFLSRVFLRCGQLDDSVRSIHVAIAAQEQICEDETELGDTLVPFYLAAAEILAVRSKQLRARSHQAALDQAERWFQTPEGTRSVRARAISLMDAHCRRFGGQILAKKEAEAQAIGQLRQERITAAFGPAALDASTISLLPDSLSLLDEAVEYCNKAWSLLEKHLGREHIATAAVHAAIAQLHMVKGESDECVRCYARAAAVYEAACNGPVPASAFIQLEIARVHHQRAFQLAKESQSQAAGSVSAARRAYLEAGEFFQSFGREFPGVSSTRRECCSLALDAFRQWLLLARGGDTPNTRQQTWPSRSLDEQREVLARIHEAAVDGYGEFSIEAGDAARELGKVLGRLGGGTNGPAGVMLLWSASTVYETHFGAADRRSRVVRKEVQDARRALSGSGKTEEIDGEEWLTV